MIISNNKTGYRYKMCAAGVDHPTEGPPINPSRFHLGVFHTILEESLGIKRIAVKLYWLSKNESSNLKMTWINSLKDASLKSATSESITDGVFFASLS
jgi:hypothetical protein